MRLAARRGFTLVETLVALVVFQVGISAVVALAAVSARDLAEGALRRKAASVARSRLEVLRASACTSPAAGSAAPLPGIREQWRVESAGRARYAVVTVAVSLPRGRTANIVAEAWVACAG